jgi:hypothetical protein
MEIDIIKTIGWRAYLLAKLEQHQFWFFWFSFTLLAIVSLFGV